MKEKLLNFTIKKKPKKKYTGQKHPRRRRKINPFRVEENNNFKKSTLICVFKKIYNFKKVKDFKNINN